MVESILDLKFFSEDLEKTLSIREYFIDLLTTLWEEEDGFSGKRPSGNSGWKYEVYTCLVKHEIVKGRLGEDGYLEEIDEPKAKKVVLEMIKMLGK